MEQQTRAQDVQVQTQAHSRTGAGAWARAWPVPLALQHGVRAAHHRLAAARVSVSRYQQEAELKDIRAALPEYAAIHSHVLQDVLARLDKTYQAFFRRVQGGREGGLPALSGARPLPLLHLQGVWQRRDAGQRLPGPVQDRAYRRALVAARWRARPRRSRSAEKRMAGMSASPAPMCQYSRLPPTGQETGIDLGIEAFATLSDGTRIFSPGWYRKAERALKTAQRRVSRRKKGSNRRRKAVTLLAKAHQKVRRQRQDFHHKTALALVRSQRHDLSRGLADGQHGQEPPSRQEHLRCGLGGVPEHPELQGSMRRAASGSRAACLHQPDVFWLWRPGPQRLIRPLASLPGLWNEPASGPQRRQEHRTGSGRPFGEAWR